MKIGFLNNIEKTSKSQSNQNNNSNNIKLDDPNSIWEVQAHGKIGKDKKVNSEVNNTTSANVEKLDKLFKSGNKLLSDKTIKRNCERLEDAKYPIFISLGPIFEGERKEIAEEALKIMGQMAESMKDPSSLTEAKIEEFTNQINKIANRFKNLKNKTEKSIELDKKFSAFEAKGGDINSINMDKLNADILATLQNEEDGEGSVEDSLAQNSSANEPEMTEKTQEIDEKIESFIKILDSGDVEKFGQTKHEYIKDSASTAKSEDKLGQTKSNPFMFSMNKKYLEL